MNAQINAYYALLRQKAENRANENLDFALNNDEIKNEYYKLKDLDFKIATATVLNKTEGYQSFVSSVSSLFAGIPVIAEITVEISFSVTIFFA